MMNNDFKAPRLHHLPECVRMWVKTNPSLQAVEFLWPNQKKNKIKNKENKQNVYIEQNYVPK